jgi:ppGpp synthetase/RelA/SpoT-type nucleotidyltranferase
MTSTDPAHTRNHPIPPRKSKTAIDKLGEALRRSPEDSLLLVKLQELREEYSAPAAGAQEALRTLGVTDSGSRVKTDKTIIDKLLRNRSMRLSQMQDIAGVRIVRDMTLSEQSRLARQVHSSFAKAIVDDLRHGPHHGYRAVHVVAQVSAYPVEIQIRTDLQHLWAEAFEKLAGITGRGIQYGDVPEFIGPDGEPADLNPVAEMLRNAEVVRDLEAGIDQYERKSWMPSVAGRDYQEEPVLLAPAAHGESADTVVPIPDEKAAELRKHLEDLGVALTDGRSTLRNVLGELATIFDSWAAGDF